MSTKIYNGFRMNTGTMIELNEFYLELRELYRSYLNGFCKDLFSRLAEENAIKLLALGIDNNKEEIDKTLDKFYTDFMPITEKRIKTPDLSIEKKREQISKQYLYELAEEEIINRVKLIRLTERRDPAFDLEGELNIVTKPGIRKNKTLLLSYGENFTDFLISLTLDPKTEEEKAFNQKYGLEAYPYWNNVDPPKDKTAEEWDAVEKDWEIAFDNGHHANQNGFSMSLFDSTEVVMFLFDVKTGLAKFLDEKSQDLKEKLARYIACEKHKNAFLDSVEEFNALSVFKYANIKTEWMKTSDYKAAAQEELDNLAGYSIPALSELLFESVEDIIQLLNKEKELQSEAQREV